MTTEEYVTQSVLQLKGQKAIIHILSTARTFYSIQ